MLSCREISRLLSDRQDRSLSWFQSMGVSLHVLGCMPCRRFGQAIRWLHRALASARSADTLSRDARERIRRALERAAQDG